MNALHRSCPMSKDLGIRVDRGWEAGVCVCDMEYNLVVIQKHLLQTLCAKQSHFSCCAEISSHAQHLIFLAVEEPQDRENGQHMMPLLGQVWMGWKQNRTECVLGTFQLKAQRSRAGVLVIDHIPLCF